MGNKIIVTHNGVSEDYFNIHSEKEVDKFKLKYSLPKNFLLYVGAIEPGKNIDKIFKALKELGDKNISLVLTGGLGWEKDNILKLLDDYNLKENVFLLPYIEDNELTLLYQSAEILLYISPYEGFGLPVLEAMASGIPVISSKIPPIKEFADNCVLFIDPNNIFEISNAILKLQSDNIFKKELIIKGKKRAESFTWNRPAQIIISNYS